MRRLILVCLLTVPAMACAQYRCVENGKLVYIDRPCATETKPSGQPPQGNVPKMIGDTGNSAYSNPYGTWRGQIQYQATRSGGVDPAAQAIVAMTIDIDPQGRVLGSSPENGCRFRGIATPGIVPTSVSLDLTLAGCEYNGYNRRLFGTLFLDPAQKYAQFSLNGNHALPLASLTFFDVKGTLRR